MGFLIKADESQDFHGPLLGFLSLPPVERQPQRRVPESRVQPAVHSQQHVVDNGHLIEQTDVLEGTGDTGPRRHLRRVAATRPNSVRAGKSDEPADEKGNQKASSGFLGKVIDRRAGRFLPRECLLIGVIRRDNRVPQRLDVGNQDEAERGDETDKRQRQRGRSAEGAARFPSVEADATRCRFVYARDGVEERGFAGAIGPDDGDDFLGRDVQRHGIHRGESAEPHRQIGNLEDIHDGGGGCGSCG